MRVRLDLAYDGTDFAGWARQPHLRTVEGELQRALATVLRQSDVRLTCAGRTDAGVHARGQVVHLDPDPASWSRLPGRSDRSPEDSLLARLAGVLPEDVVVRSSRVVPDAFDARFAALWRCYRYRLADSVARWDPIRRRDVTWTKRELDVDAMRAAAEVLVGEHDFLSFCKPRAGATTIRTLQQVDVHRDPGSGVIVTTVRADAFCHSMVRSIMGALVAVGEGRRPVHYPAELLDRPSREGSAPVIGPRGLTLEEVGYPPDEELADRVRETRRVRGPLGAGEAPPRSGSQ